MMLGLGFGLSDTGGGGGGGGAGVVDLTGANGITIRVQPATVEDATWPVTIDRGIIIWLSVSSTAANNVDVAIYSDAARLPAQLLYDATGIDAVASPFIDATPFYIEDIGATQDLYVRVRNNSGVVSDVTLTAYAIGE
jgi:hypothetical protein